MLLSHRQLSAWYRQVAQQLDAGLPLAQALLLSQGTGVSAARLEAMAAKIKGGGSADEALRTAEPWLPLADLLALSAASDAGRMPPTLRHLSDRHEQLAAAKLKVIFACLYPLGVLHFGLLLLPLIGMIDAEKGFQWSSTDYVRGVAMSVLPLWGAVLGVWLLARRGSTGLARGAELVPFLRGHLRARALADFSFALANFLEAGVPIGQAWAAAGLTSRSRQLKAAAEAMTAVIAARAAPGEKLAAWPCFPPDFVALYRTGEQTGQLEGNLYRLSANYQDSASRGLTLITLIYPALLFLGVAGAVVYMAVMIYGRYLSMLGEVGK